MKISKEQNGDKLIVCLEGRLDTSTAPMLEEEMEGSLSGVNELILDFTNLEYISSAGLRVLLSLHKTMSKSGGMKIRNTNEIVLEVFNVTGFSEILVVE